jgi:hypothetical protein
MAHSRISILFLTGLLVFFLAPMAEVMGFWSATSVGNKGTVVEVTPARFRHGHTVRHLFVPTMRHPM